MASGSRPTTSGTTVHRASERGEEDGNIAHYRRWRPGSTNAQEVPVRSLQVNGEVDSRTQVPRPVHVLSQVVTSDAERTKNFPKRRKAAKVRRCVNAE